MSFKNLSLSFILLFNIQLLLAQKDTYIPNLNQLIEHTQLSSDESDKMSLIWWIPKEFWRSALAEDPNSSPESIKEFEDIFKNYTVLLVVDGRIGSFGNVTYVEEKVIRSYLKILDSKLNVYKPLRENEISKDLKDMFAIWKPMFSSMLGDMGENINYFVFQNNYKSEVMNASEPGDYAIQMSEESFKFKLPIGVLFPPKTCRKCKETFMGSYKYCPYDGKKL